MAGIAPIHPLADAYASDMSSAMDELRQLVLDETMQFHPHAQMLSGPVQGKLLEMISRMLRPRRILEIGTFTGFSALCLAEGLSPGGELHTLELREEDAAKARSYFDRSRFRDRIFIHTGYAIETIPSLQESWDLVFIDADKTGYIDYYEAVLPRLREGGFILADNVLFHGDVLEEPVKGKNAQAIHAFNQHVQQDTRTEQVLLTIRDGLLCIRKL